LHIAPCLPAAWNEYKLTYRYRATEYRITVRRSESDEEQPDATRVTVDGVTQDAGYILLIDDKQLHEVEVRVHVGARTSAPLLAS
jgi:cyclic beta-1,2-glucan synthetase